MGRIKYSAFFIFIIISCNNNLDEPLIYKNDLTYVKNIFIEEVNFIDKNVIEIRKTILIDDIFDTLFIRKINGKEILGHLINLKFPTSYKKEENKLGYSLFFNNKSNALKSITFKNDSIVNFFFRTFKYFISYSKRI